MPYFPFQNPLQQMQQPGANPPMPPQKFLPGPAGPGQNGQNVPLSPNSMRAPVDPNMNQMAYTQALQNMMKYPKPLPIAMSTTPAESPVIDGNDNVSEVVPATEQDAVAVVQAQDSRDNISKSPNRANQPFNTMNYP